MISFGLISFPQAYTYTYMCSYLRLFRSNNKVTMHATVNREIAPIGPYCKYHRFVLL